MSYTIDDLKTLMARLRDPETGCPWDTRQTYRTIVPHTLEEAYEVADAIERDFKSSENVLRQLQEIVDYNEAFERGNRKSSTLSAGNGDGVDGMDEDDARKRYQRFNDAVKRGARSRTSTASSLNADQFEDAPGST